MLAGTRSVIELIEKHRRCQKCRKFIVIGYHLRKLAKDIMLVCYINADTINSLDSNNSTRFSNRAKKKNKTAEKNRFGKTHK